MNARHILGHRALAQDRPARRGRETDRVSAAAATDVRLALRALPHFLAVFLVLAGMNARADYLPLALTELFEGSELIVLGTIESVGDDSFTLRKAEVFTGSIGDAPLQVKKYRDWTGGRRWSAYRTGQTVLLFLSPTGADEKAAGEDWRIRGHGGEGEMPIEGDAIFPHGLNLKGFRRQVYQVDGGELYGYCFALGTFISALTGYLRCFGSPSEVAAAGIEKQESKCTERELAAYQATSELHRYLVSSRSAGAN